MYVFAELLNSIAHKITDKQKDNSILGGVQLLEREADNKMIFIQIHRSLHSNKMVRENQH